MKKTSVLPDHNKQLHTLALQKQLQDLMKQTNQQIPDPDALDRANDSDVLALFANFGPNFKQKLQLRHAGAAAFKVADADTSVLGREAMSNEDNDRLVQAENQTTIKAHALLCTVMAPNMAAKIMNDGRMANAETRHVLLQTWKVFLPTLTQLYPSGCNDQQFIRSFQEYAKIGTPAERTIATLVFDDMMEEANKQREHERQRHERHASHGRNVARSAHNPMQNPLAHINRGATPGATPGATHGRTPVTIHGTTYATTPETAHGTTPETPSHNYYTPMTKTHGMPTPMASFNVKTPIKPRDASITTTPLSQFRNDKMSYLDIAKQTSPFASEHEIKTAAVPINTGLTKSEKAKQTREANKQLQHELDLLAAATAPEGRSTRNRPAAPKMAGTEGKGKTPIRVIKVLRRRK